MRILYIHAIGASALVSQVTAFTESLGRSPSLLLGVPKESAPRTTISIRSNKSSKQTSLSASSSISQEGKKQKNKVPNPFITDCDDSNTPPSLAKLISSIHSVKSGSDIRGIYKDHARIGTILNVSHAIESDRSLTPFSVYCYGAAFAQMVQIRSGKGSAMGVGSFMSRGIDEWGDERFYMERRQSQTVICIGRDPRMSGSRLADSFCRGVESVEGCIAHYTGLASTPAMFEFCRSDMCDGAVMITASHLPEDRNGLKFFTKTGGLTSRDIETLAERASISAREWHDLGIVPPSSGEGAVLCTSWVDHMPYYQNCLRNSILHEVKSVNKVETNDAPSPLAGLRVVLNPGKGSGYFFNEILQGLGADVSNSIHLVPDGTFPTTGVPNPEYKAMIEETKRVCEECDADVGIMLDTDADRSGFIIPRNVNSDGSKTTYEALNRNRLIALLSVIFQSSSPGCTIVTDSVTSEGLASFIDGLGLNHVRYLKGYANVIGKAKELTESGKALAEVAIETSGHCAMRENGYLDDGTYTSVKIVGLLARLSRARSQNGEGSMSLLDLISELEEMDEVSELRMNVLDGSIATTNQVFSQIIDSVEDACTNIQHWELDSENLEGVRVRTGNGGFFMLRKSLHDPIISLQVEGLSKEQVRGEVIDPILGLMDSSSLDLTCLHEY